MKNSNASTKLEEKPESPSEKKFELNIFRLFVIRVEGYPAEEVYTLINSITNPKRLWPLIILLILLGAIIVLSGDSTWAKIGKSLTEWWKGSSP